MLISGLIAIIGLGLVLPSLYQLNPIIQFYMGRNRELYFASELRWMMIIRNNTSTLLVGLAILSALVIRSFGWWSVIFGLSLILGLAIAASNTYFMPFKPAWLRDFESSHLPHDLTLIKARGRWLMENYPAYFPRIIASQEGWEAWVVTVI